MGGARGWRFAQGRGGARADSGECNCINCDAPGRFLLQRDEYSLEFWNGDRWYPEIYIRGRSKDGAVLTLSSESPELLRMAPHVPVEATYGFEYFMRAENVDGSELTKSLSIRIMSHTRMAACSASKALACAWNPERTWTSNICEDSGSLLLHRLRQKRFDLLQHLRPRRCARQPMVVTAELHEAHVALGAEQFPVHGTRLLHGYDAVLASMQ